MPIPMLAITNASTCLTDAQVEAVVPALQKQVSNDFRAYWDLDCTLNFLPKGQPIVNGWWQSLFSTIPIRRALSGITSSRARGLHSERSLPSLTSIADPHGP